MCNAYNLTHRSKAINEIARALQMPLLGEVQEFSPRYRIGIKQRGLILRPTTRGLTWKWARWSLYIPGVKEQPPYPMNNARSDKLLAWPWRALSRQRCLIPATGFWEPEKLAREKGTAPWSYYTMKDREPFWMAGLWSEEPPDPETGEVRDSYTLIIGDANQIMRIHDRMPVILTNEAARRWLGSGPLPADILQVHPAEAMEGWRVADSVKNSRVEPTPEMALPIQGRDKQR
ncbi:Putative SOS response-associated peptidase YedK [Arboricoccus pini]|uniref:Abasic site processing protein n=1 Tax=Arboricoccus pini TaxID=1963835 RepID=A0A212QQ82_9PROT|nr:SOS response-associated peptidase family protein [Arboricoccus pini]SNB61647.1 Putative SOS response-associated peptidase YedK [Arboricoccus pini]